ncbi:uncharacterized protein G2W53_034091 [Senna tora]|uniref:Uncharacterized protein n=1 Tax=Senna tora TaxID=362788 RepID=A0A834SZT5_9FABA|nr:uncharacterized protein G2W53_034091 [Senna tora]
MTSPTADSSDHGVAGEQQQCCEWRLPWLSHSQPLHILGTEVACVNLALHYG